MKTFKEVVSESSLTRVYKQYLEHDSGTITAFRSAEDCLRGADISTTQNKKRNSILRSKLLVLGYGVTSIDGEYIEGFGTPDATIVKEEAYFVVDLKNKGHLKRDLIDLGEAFEQDSITFSKKNGDYFIISSNECENGYPGFGKIGVEKKLAKPLMGDTGEFYSKIKGRPFVFKSEGKLESISDFYPTEIRSIVDISRSSF